MQELDRANALRHRKLPIDRAFPRDDGAIAAKPGECDMRTKRPLVRLLKRLKERGAQLRQVRSDRAFHPQKPRASRLRTISDMAKFQHEFAELAGDAAKLPDRIRYRSLVPRRHQREMNVGRSNQANRKSLQFPRHPRQLPGDLGRHLDCDENARPSWAA